jgi:hypothetical protein
MTIHVFIDTSSLPLHPKHVGVGFERLCQLVRDKVVRVYLSAVVVKEWQSHLVQDFENVVDETSKPFKKLLKHPWAQELPNKNLFQEAAELLGSLNPSDIANRGFQDLLAQLQPNILQIGAHHGQSITDDYFSGAPPFQRVKNRDDIPDAFIYHSAKDLVSQLGDLYCVIADNNLRGKLAQIQNISVYSKLDDFVASELITSLVSKQLQEQNWRSYFLQLPSELSSQIKYLSSELHELLTDELAFSEISHPKIPDDNNMARVVFVDEPKNIEFDLTSIKDFGPGLITVPIVFDCDASIDFSVYRGEAYDVPEGVWVNYGDPELDHYFDAGGSVNLSVSCVLSIRLDFERLLPGNKVQINSVKIDHIESVEVSETESGTIFLD